MIPVTAKASILLAVAPVNRRKQFDGLIAHCRQELSVDLCSGTFVAFINRAKTMIRVLVFDATGQWLMTKRISRDRFQGWPTGTEPVSPLAARELMAILKSQPFELARQGENKT